MRSVSKIIRIQLVVVVAFIFFKAIRPGVLDGNSPEAFKLFLLSFPNFCEGVVGVLMLTLVGLYSMLKLKFKIRDQLVYLMAAILAAIYVILQEVKIHNLGGNNVYDPNDILFSIVGLIVGYLIVNKMKPSIGPKSG